MCKPSNPENKGINSDVVVIVCEPIVKSRKQICGLLAKVGVSPENIICTETISETAEVAESASPNLILIDITLKDEPGYSICTILDHSRDIYDVPVILMAYKDEGVNPRRAMVVKGRGFLSKPIQLMPLKKQITRILHEKELESKLKQKYSIPLNDEFLKGKLRESDE